MGEGVEGRGGEEEGEGGMEVVHFLGAKHVWVRYLILFSDFVYELR